MKHILFRFLEGMLLACVLILLLMCKEGGDINYLYAGF